MMEFMERVLTKEGPWAAISIFGAWCLVKSARWLARLVERLSEGTISNFFLPLKERGIKWFDGQQEATAANTQALYQIQDSLKEHDERSKRDVEELRQKIAESRVFHPPTST